MTKNEWTMNLNTEGFECFGFFLVWHRALGAFISTRFFTTYHFLNQNSAHNAWKGFNFNV